MHHAAQSEAAFIYYLYCSKKGNIIMKNGIFEQLDSLEYVVAKEIAEP